MVEIPSMDELLEAIEQVDLERPWHDVAPTVWPMLPRRRPLPPAADPPVRRRYPPGIDVGFGLDIGPAMLHVVSGQLDRWGVSEQDVADRAFANVRTHTKARRQFGIVEDRIQGVQVSGFQSREGWASALLLMPELLAYVLGAGPALFIAPMRDLLLRLPIDTDPELAHWLLEEFAAFDPNALDIPVLSRIDDQLRFVPTASVELTPGISH
jgi:hypothetical protein